MRRLNFKIPVVLLAGVAVALACSGEELGNPPQDSAGAGAAGSTVVNGGAANGGVGARAEGGAAGFVEAGGGGAPPASNADFLWSTSGTRLQARMLVSDEGFAIPHDIFDSDRSATCAPQKFSDGTTRCLTAPIWRAAFSDAACQERVVMSPFGGDQPKAGDLVTMGDAGCDGVDSQQLFEISGEVPVPAELFSNFESTCTSTGAPLNDKAYSVVPFDAAELVSFTADQVVLGRLAVPVLLGDDGSRVAMGGPFSPLHDLERDTSVLLAPSGLEGSDRVYHLLPSLVPNRIACTMQPCDFSPSNGGGPTPATPFFPLDPPACGGSFDDVTYVTWRSAPFGDSVQTYRVEAADTTIYVAAGGASPGGPMPAHGLQALEPVPLEAWLRPSRFQPEGRFGLHDGLEVEDMILSNTTTLVDNDFGGAGCYVQMAADGERRCLPDSAGSIAYVDADCQEPVGYYWSPPNTGGSGAGGGAAVPTHALEDTAGITDQPRRVYALQEPTSSDQYFQRAYGDCVSTTISSDNAVRSVTEVEPETFGRFTLEVR
jgi:hypothetical protein